MAIRESADGKTLQPSHPTLWAALSAAQGELPVVRKENVAEVRHKTGGMHKYTYATLGDVAMAAYPVLAKHGLAFSVSTETTDYGLLAVGKLAHESGETIGAEFPILRGSPQEIGSGLTYARRYLLGCLSGIVTDDDDDGAQAQANYQQRPVQAPNTAHHTPNPNRAPKAVKTDSAASVDWDSVLAEAATITTKDGLRELWQKRNVGNAHKAVRDEIMGLVESCEPAPQPEPAPVEITPDEAEAIRQAELAEAEANRSTLFGPEPEPTVRHQTP